MLIVYVFTRDTQFAKLSISSNLLLFQFRISAQMI